MMNSEEKNMVSAPFVSARTGSGDYTALAGVFFLNMLVPTVHLSTERYLDATDCYDACGILIALFLLFFWMPSILIWGLPLLGMSLYSLIGRHIGFKGWLLKFLIVYGTRYVGLFWHIITQFYSVYLIRDGIDYYFPIIYLIMSYLLEQAYTDLGAGAVKYIDPDWTQNPNALFPFTEI